MNSAAIFSCVLSLLAGKVESKCSDTITPLWGHAYALHVAASIESTSKVYHVSPELVAAVINRESSFRQHVRSPKGALGLMQVLRGGAVQGEWRRLSDAELEDVDLNIYLGVRYLAYAKERCKKHYLSLYNGCGCVASRYEDSIVAQVKRFKRRRRG